MSMFIRKRLDNDFDRFRSDLIRTLDEYNECLHFYSDSMHNSLQVNTYLNEDELIKIHEQTKNATIAEFRLKSEKSNRQIISSLTRRMKDAISKKITYFERENDFQRKNINVSARIFEA